MSFKVSKITQCFTLLLEFYPLPWGVFLANDFATFFVFNKY